MDANDKLLGENIYNIMSSWLGQNPNFNRKLVLEAPLISPTDEKKTSSHIPLKRKKKTINIQFLSVLLSEQIAAHFLYYQPLGQHW